MYYIVISHGDYAKSTIESAEMITGKVNDYKCISFTEDMSLDFLKEQVINTLKSDKEECVGAIVDLVGGTPFNVVNKIIKEKDLPIITGLSLSLIVFLNSYNNIDIAISEAKDNLKLFGSANEKIQNYKIDKTKTNKGKLYFRLDERLIHGQVATFWLRSLNITRIMVIGDDIIKNEIEKEALKLAVPIGVSLSILTEDNAVKRINDGIYNKDNLFIVVNSPKIAQNLLEKGLPVDELIIGNMGQKENREYITKSIYASPEEKNILSNICMMPEVKVYSQMVPNDEKIFFKKLLGEV